MEFGTSYKSFSTATSDSACTLRLPAYRSCHLGRYHPYPRFKGSRHVEYEDLVRPMATNTVADPCCSAPYTGPRLDQLLPTIAEGDEHDLEGLGLAVSGKSPEGRMRRISLTTLVIDLALVIRNRLQRGRGQKEADLVFVMLT
ncbi:hypothetical protein FIBSPDRAFT_1037641 [Athelia psychrophila]|uniref:Uncharacterized protein n=1 Tax=Athelia psychrophila TaxID=1759441 RepID=A0A166U020_9AGAM|nr:hypothetical protein FIBSPDRAFT_1037641 [Fibularhizoctonia sp. CBS 109695]